MRVGFSPKNFFPQYFVFLGKKHNVLMSFSIWSNLKKLSSDGENDDGLQCIHGLKVFSMFLIIMGHRIMFGIGSPLLNPSYIESVSGYIRLNYLISFRNQFIFNIVYNVPIKTVRIVTFFYVFEWIICFIALSTLNRIF